MPLHTKSSRRALVAGNWKMNGSLAANAALVASLVADTASRAGIDVLVCPPAVYLDSVGRALVGSAIALGAQNLCEQPQRGAFTGEIHGEMLRELGCTAVLVGHSERRALYGEDDERVARKFAAAIAAGLMPVLCLGETLAQREQGSTEAVVGGQLHAVLEHCGAAAFAGAVIAYEPVWAIGTGRTATPDVAQAVHAFIRGQLARADAKLADSIRLLYGGSVTAANAASLFSCADIDGALVGGASLKAADFLSICAAASTRAGTSI